MALKIARGKFLCILKPDVIVQKNAFKNLIEYLNQHPLVGIVAPRLVYQQGKFKIIIEFSAHSRFDYEENSAKNFQRSHA